MGRDNVFFKKRKSKLPKYLFLLLAISFIFYIFLTERQALLNFFKREKKLQTKEETMTRKIELKNLPTWDLTNLYSSIKSSQIKADLETLKRLTKNFVRDYKTEDKLQKINGTNLFRAIRRYEVINEIMGKLATFAFLNYAQDLSKEENVIFYQKISEDLTDVSTSLVFFTLDLNKLSRANLDKKFAESPALDKYKQFIEDVRMAKDYQLEESLEKLFLEKSVTTREAWARLFDQTVDSLIFVYNGEEQNVSEMLKLLTDKDPEVRKKAGKIFSDKLAENIRLFAHITNVLIKDKEISDRWRGFKEPISSRNLSNLIEDEVVETLVKTVKKNYPKISHRYYRLKAKMMHQRKLHYTDRNAPLPFDDDKLYEWEETRTIVLNAYKDFSPRMADIGQKFFDNSWIDVPTRKGKRAGAFAHPAVPSVHPYLLLNYQGKTRDIMTLAHELGHGVHQYLAGQEQGYLMADTPLTLAETASVFGEQLTFRALLKAETDPEQRKAILANKIEDMINTVVRQIAFLEFEKRVHAERKNGEIPTERINEIWMEVQKESLGKVFDYDEEYKYYWSYIPHFVHSPFYVYSYAFGDCLVNSLYSIYQENPEGFEEKYIELLKAGGSKRYDELLKPFGLDPHDARFWQKGLDVISDLIDELEKMV